MNRTLSRIGSLDVIEMPSNGNGPTMVVMHGYGADFRDLAPLASVADPERRCRWLLPNGPLEVPIGPHIVGRAWFPIDMIALEQAMMTGTHRDLSGLTPREFLESADKIEALIKAADCPVDQLILAGFSQGAMLACEVALRLAKNVKGLILLSPTLIAAERWREAVTAHAGLRVFQSHGTTDPLLGFRQSESLRDLLLGAGCDVEFLPFTGGHEIPPPVMQRLKEFLASLIA